MSRIDAALLGAREVGFTVFSISISLIAVFIPILLMGGIVGRLFREFAVTLSAAILVSLVISLTTTPMMCAFLVDPPKPREKQSRVGRWSENAFSWMERRYERALDWVLDAGPLMLVVLAVTVVLTGYLYVIVPKGFFPQQDTGQMQGGIQSDQSSSFAISNQRIRQFVGIIRHDPSVQTVVAFAGGRASGGFMLVDLKPRSQRKGGAVAVIQRLRPKLGHVVGASLFLNPAQDLRIGGRQGNASYQFTLEGPSLALLREWAGKLAEALKADPALTDVNTDQEDHGLETLPHRGPRHRRAARHHQHRHRQHALRRLWTAAGLDDLSRDQPVQGGDGGGAAVHQGPHRAERHLRQQRLGGLVLHQRDRGGGGGCNRGGG